MSIILPVILSGGSGSRLWPLSRELFPKQLLPLLDGKKSLLQNTFKRLDSVPNILPPLIVCNEEHRFMVAEQLREMHTVPSAILLEPVGRNTAPAIALAALKAIENGEDPILLVLPADHIITKEDAFAHAVATALPFAERGKLVTFGMVPTKPDTGYGYISKTGHFVEKPDLKTAEKYIAEGYYWNSGMFMFRASVILNEMKHYVPDIMAVCEAAMSSSSADKDFLRVNTQPFETCRSESIDYAIMEKASDIVVIPAELGWSDLGSWTALWEFGEQDEHNNFLEGDVHIENVKGSYLHADHRMLAVIGMQDCIVMETADAVLVAHKDNVQDVKKIVERLKKAGRSEAASHRRVYRPWGFYESVDEAANFKVKRITVNPGATLSLQMHHHRAEHWVVVHGEAQVTRDKEVFMLSENQSTYIPQGAVHRLSNLGKTPLELIEVQTGDYLEEDDIVRLEDIYGRENR